MQDRKPDWFVELRKAPDAIPAGASTPAPLLFDSQHRAIAEPDQWGDRRSELLRTWRAFLGEIRLPRAAPVLDVIATDHVDGVTRRLVRYEVEPGVSVEAYWLEPDEPREPRPGVIVLHSTTHDTIKQPAGLAGAESHHVGLHLARRGYVTLCPPNFLWQFGASKDFQESLGWLRRRHPGVKGMAKMLFDAQRALDALSALPSVDPRRLGAFGHSLGGKEVLYLAAFDSRVRVSVCSEAGIGMGYSNWEAPWYLGQEIREPGFSLDHGQILALAAPRAFLLMGGDSADGAISWPYVEAALPLWKLLGAPEGVGLLNHHEGHSLPVIARERAYTWIDWHLRSL